LAEPTTQRLFFAVWPDEGVREQLRAAQQGLPRRGGRPVHVEDIHVTLAFLGQVDEEHRACMEQAAAGVRGAAFELLIDRQGYWPRPRVAWCAPAVIPEPLRDLVHRLNRALRPCGFEPERRAYSPHVTLFRDSRASAGGSARAARALAVPRVRAGRVRKRPGRPPLPGARALAARGLVQ